MSPHRCYINEPPLRLKKYCLLQIAICYRWVAQNNLVFIMLNLFFVPLVMHQPFYVQFILEKRISQGCALEEPDGPWRPTFALDRLENLTFFIQILYLAPWILQVPSTGLPSSFLKAPRVRHIIPTSSHELCIQSWVMDLFAFNVCLSLCPVVVVWLSVACTGVHYVLQVLQS